MINKDTLRTSEYWSRTVSHIEMINHDGWRHESFEDFHYVWFEESITEREFFKRLSNSTVRMIIK